MFTAINVQTCNKPPSGIENCSHIFQVSLISIYVKRAAYHRKYTIGNASAFVWEMRPSLNDIVLGHFSFAASTSKYRHFQLF